MLTDIVVWHDKAARTKKAAAEVRVCTDDGTLIEDCTIPSERYPLKGKYRAFSFRNCKLVNDPAVLEIFDRQEYRIGHCYSNTQALVQELRAAGYDAVSYVGWLFVGNDQLPFHHCWAVLNGKSVLDLSDDTATLRYCYRANIQELEDASEDKLREFFAAFVEHSRQWKHSERCAPVGFPFPEWYYVGCKCDPEDGKMLYRKFVSEHPGYEAQRGINNSGRSNLQQMLHERGLMD